MDELIEKLERADGADRELDARIRLSVYEPNGYVQQSPINGEWCVFDGSNDIHGRPRLSRNGKHGTAYTSSIDAALTLVPDGWGHTLVCQPPDHKPWCAVREWRWSDERSRYETGNHMASSGECKASTPALAMCIAALKARAWHGRI